MKKLFAVALSAVLLLSMAACGDNPQKEGEKTQSYYVVTSRKHYTNGELSNSAEFTYDEKGRPLTMKIEIADYRIMESELTYDEYGNRIREVYTTTDLERGGTSSREDNYEMTYQDGKLVRCTIVNENVGFDLQYDEKGRLVRVDYDEAYSKTRGSVWHTYAYDEQGRLIQATQCARQYLPEEAGSGIMEWVRQMRYQYGQNKNVFVTEYGGSVFYEKDAAEIPQIELTKTDSQYNYCFDEQGRVIYVGATEDDIHQESESTLRDDEDCTFDEYGNLLVYETDITRTEYTYEKLELTEAEVEMAIQLGHGISEYLAQYVLFGNMDPLHFYVAPVIYFVPYLRNPVYYLVPCPLWYMPNS